MKGALGIYLSKVQKQQRMYGPREDCMGRAMVDETVAIMGEHLNGISQERYISPYL